jgi:phosphoglycerate dehydrogenase-like enzyme
MAEYIFTYVLYLNRDLEKHFENQKRRAWDRERPTRLSGKTMGIIGLGSVGQEIAKRGKQFGMNILGIKLTPKSLENVDRVFGAKDLSQVIPEVDYLVVVVPLTSRTYHMLGEKELSLMKEGTVVFNIGRGKTVDERALIEILKTGRIKAVLDVFETEPLPAESELWDLQNVLITPHTSGMSPIEEICEEFLVNYGKWTRGESFCGLIDRKKGY